MRQGFVEVIGGTIYAFEDAAPEILNMTPANAMRHVGKTLDREIEIDDSKLKSMDLTPREIEEARVWHRQYCERNPGKQVPEFDPADPYAWSARPRDGETAEAPAPAAEEPDDEPEPLSGGPILDLIPDERDQAPDEPDAT